MKKSPKDLSANGIKNFASERTSLINYDLFYETYGPNVYFDAKSLSRIMRLFT